MTSITYVQFLNWVTGGHPVDHYYYRALYAQAKLESGFNSRLYTEANNMFGMRPSKKRKKFYIGIDDTSGRNGEFAIYSGLDMAIFDRLDLDVDFGNGGSDLKTKADLIPYMNAVQEDGYCFDCPKYVQSWSATYNEIFGNLPLGDPQIMKIGENADGEPYFGVIIDPNTNDPIGEKQEGDGDENGNQSSGNGGSMTNGLGFSLSDLFDKIKRLGIYAFVIAVVGFIVYKKYLKK